MSGFLKLSPLSLSTLLLFVPMDAGAYPDGYPRVGTPIVIPTVSGTEHRDMRLVPNHERNEYLAVWKSITAGETDAVVELYGVRLNGTDMQPLDSAPVRLFSATGAWPLDEDMTTDGINSYDLAWDDIRNRYFLAIYANSRDLTPEPGEQIGQGALFVAYLDEQISEMPIEDMLLVASCDGANNNGRGLRTLYHPARQHVYVFNTFGLSAVDPASPWNEEGTVTPPSGICARSFTFVETAQGKAATASLPHQVMLLSDVTPGNVFRPFYMSDLAVEYDKDRGNFVIASVIGESFLTCHEVTCLDAQLRSDVVVQVMNSNFSLPSGGNTAYARVSRQDDIRIEPKMNGHSSDTWTAHEPQLVRGPSVTVDDVEYRQWLVTFKGNYLVDSERRVDLWSHRIRVKRSDSTIVIDSPSGPDRRLSDVARMGTRFLNVNAHGLWLPGVSRFLVPWGAGSGTHQYKPFATSLSNSSSPDASVDDLETGTEFLPVRHGSTGAYFSGFAPVLSGESDTQAYAVNQAKDQLVIQKVNLAWLDLSATVELSAAEPAFDEQLGVHISVQRADTSGIGDVPATFDSGQYRLHLSVPEHLALVNSPLPGSLEEGFVAESSVNMLDEGQSKTFFFLFQNSNPFNEPVSGEIRVALESDNHVIDYDASNETAVADVTLASNPEGIEPPGNDNGDGNSDGDDTGDTGGSDNTNPDGGDGKDVTGGGGGAFGWLLLGLARLAMGRRRVS